MDQLPLIFGGSKLVQQQEKHPPSAAAEKQQPPASPAKSGKGKGAAAAAKEAAGESNTPKLRSGDAANKVGRAAGTGLVGAGLTCVHCEALTLCPALLCSLQA